MDPIVPKCTLCPITEAMVSPDYPKKDLPYMPLQPPISSLYHALTIFLSSIVHLFTSLEFDYTAYSMGTTQPPEHFKYQIKPP